MHAAGPCHWPRLDAAALLERIITQLRASLDQEFGRLTMASAAVGRRCGRDCRPSGRCYSRKSMPASRKKRPNSASAHSRRRAENAHLRARAGRAGCGALHGRSQSRAARRRGGGGRARAGAGRRRHRQDPRADDAHCPHHVHGPRARLADPGRDLHQQGRARDEGAHRRAGRRRRRGHALARHVPRHRRQDPAPACRAGRA